ncbi:hypothetical protein SAMN04488026_100313 [Aliiruegeria lutimaris]|uniref:Uncharacterized protein n=1 Tax=Aliiruegeria lutimaris TaxID=571298 RepID=A0A1G8KK59_9RHOB|nr:hypothetical protein SAMN04488026_100313 [Aliiruegeria lutimaris]
MQQHSHIPGTQQRLQRSKRKLLAVLLCMLVVMQAMLPVPAAAYAGGDLVEICSESGVLVLRIDADGNVIDPEDAPCPECDDCQLCANVALGDQPAQFRTIRETGHAVRPDWIATQPVKDNPAQFWADNRAPPLRSEKATDLSIIPFMGPPLTEGRARWI